MKVLSDKWYKQAELITALISVILILTYSIVSVFSGDVKIFSDLWYTRSICYATNAVPYLMLIFLSIVSYKLKGDTRIIPWLLIGMQVVLGYATDNGIINFWPIGMFEVANLFYMSSLKHIILTFSVAMIFLVPIAKRPVMLGYTGLTTLLFTVDFVLEAWYGIFIFEDGIHWTTLIWVLAAISYQLTLFWYSFELTSDNRKRVYSKLFDVLIGWDIWDIFDDDDMEGDDEEILETDTTYYLKDVLSNEIDDFDCEETNQWREIFKEAVVAKVDNLTIDGEDFLLDSLENSEIIYEFKYNENTVTVEGIFTHSFNEDRAAYILRKKSVLNKTFKDIKICAIADTDIGVDSIEEGTFIIRLKTKEFDISEGYNSLQKYMVDFIKTIILIQNTESCE